MEKRKAGRPAINDDEKRVKPVPVKFSKYEKMRVVERATKDRIPVSVWIRNAALEKLNGSGK